VEVKGYGCENGGGSTKQAKEKGKGGGVRSIRK
jgi:hypothetical protein